MHVVQYPGGDVAVVICDVSDCDKQHYVNNNNT